MDRISIYTKLKERGFAPKTVVDGGYAIGEWTNTIRHVFPELKVLAAEPNATATPAFEDDIVSLENVLFWSEDNVSIPFYKSMNSSGWCTGDSAFRELSHHYGENNTIIEEIPTITINSMAKKHGIDKIDIIKLDVQGAELECLRGASDYLHMVDFVELECPVVAYNAGAPTLYEIFKFMENQFEVYDIIELHRAFTDPRADLIQIDIVFRNKNCEVPKIY